ncbi:MAG: sulfatase-like hydrolase/transferase [Bacteroidota bacterium]
MNDFKGLVLVILSLIGCTKFREISPDPTSEKLNVLFSIADDLRIELRAYEYMKSHTPNIDRLAAEGRLFEEAYVQKAKCNLSLMSFLTGLRPDETGVYRNKDHLRQ